MTETKKGITVVGVEAENFHRLTFARVEFIPGQGLVRITGKNGAGKTSLLRSIRAALGGAGEVLPDPIHETDKEDATSVVKLRLSNGFTVTRRFTEAQPKGYLTVEGADGGKHAQGKLAEWLGPLSFDPLAFFDLKAERQREILLSLGGDPELPAKLQAVRAKRAQKYEERTPWISTKRRAAAVQQPEGQRPRPIDISAELARMGELQQVERQRQDMIREHDRALQDAKRAVEHAIERQAEDVRLAELRLRDANDEVLNLELEEGQLEKQLEDIRAKLIDARGTVAVASEHLGTVQERTPAEVPQPSAPDLPTDPAQEMDAVRGRIAKADTIRGQLEPWTAFDRARAELAEAVHAIDGIGAEMDALEQQEDQLIAAAGIPVDGLSFSEDGEPVLNGRALAVASGGEKIRLSVGVALAANPDLRVCLIDEANDLDLDGLAALDILAKAHGFQVWAARIGLEGPGEIVIEDGVALERDAKPVKVMA